MHVRVLPPTVADQIAAGEVVERAASVVKELCENALDAGAHRIDIEIEGGGRRLVRVVDDGAGMEREDAILALRRHATSKIASVDDLWGLRSFGFRGEALPSIAAVSRFALSTKRRDSGTPAGVRLDVEGGHLVRESEVGMPDGTQVEVRDLFFNTPARLKFQKTEATEAANVTEAVLRLALAHEAVHFRLRTGGRPTLDLPPHRSRAERVRAALARRGAGVLQEAAGRAHGVEVQAFLAAPEEASSTARSTFLYVGTRFVKDRALLHAMALGYGDALEKGRYPLGVLFVEVPGQELDINVHPQKLEVRFARSHEVYAAVREVVSVALARAPWRTRERAHSLPPPGADEPPAWMSPGASRLEEDADPVRGDEDFGATLGTSSAHEGPPQVARGRAFSSPRAPASAPGRVSERPVLRPVPTPISRDPAFRPTAAAAGPSPVDVGDAGPRPLPAGWREVGVAYGEALAFETPEGVRLIDAHVLLAEVVRRELVARSGPLPTASLLFAMPVELEPRHVLDEPLRGALTSLGFRVKDWQDQRVVLEGVPAPAADADPKPLLWDVLLALKHDPRASGDALGVIACYAAFDATARLDEARDALSHCRFTAEDWARPCSHGRVLSSVLSWPLTRQPKSDG
jgi:DNA mismatch repair protein MutL